MRRNRRWLVWTALALALLVGGTFLYAERITRGVIESGAEDVLGVDVSVGFVRLGFLGGGVQIFDLAVRNPEGFGTADLLRVGHVDIGVWLPGFLADRVEVPKIDVRDVRVELERRGESTNYGPVLARLDRSSRGPEDWASHTDSTFLIGQIRVRKIEADVRMLPEIDAIPGANELSNIKIQIPEIVLHHVTSRGDPTELVAQLTDLVAVAVLESIARHATGLPVAMVDELTSVSGSLGGTSLEVVGQVTQVGGRAVGDTIEGVLGGEAAEVTREAAETVDQAFEGAAHFVENEAHAGR